MSLFAILYRSCRFGEHFRPLEAVIGDIYKLEERSTAMGITFGIRLFRSSHVVRAVNNASSVGSSGRTCSRPIGRRSCHGVYFRDHYHDDLPFIDGAITTHLTDPSVRCAFWRPMQAVVECTALLRYFLMYVPMPDTLHPGTRASAKSSVVSSRGCG